MPQRIQGLLALALWGLAALLIMQQGPLGLEESGAKALLLDWSIADQVANSAVTLGIPDWRALLWLPVGYLWTGQVLAIKIFSILLMILTAQLLYRWRAEEGQEEAALLATGLLLISPVTITQLDSLSPGAGLLTAFIMGAWLNREYRATPTALGGWFFAQLALCAFAVSLHPIGLAYPLSLLWAWYKTPIDRRQQKIFFIGIIAVVLLTLVMRMGWHDVWFWQNPVQSAAALLWGSSLDESLSAVDVLTGVAVLTLLLMLAISQRKRLWQDLMGRNLLLGVVIGLCVNDAAWSFIALAFLLFVGAPVLLQPRAWFAERSFLMQRGWLWVLLLVVATVFMRADRAHHDQIHLQMMGAQDQLIKTFADNVNALRAESDAKNIPMPRIRVASQWPARTMVACRCDALPLPPAAADAPAQMALLKGVSHLILAPSDARNLGLAANLSQLGTQLETVSLQPGGVLLQVRKTPQ